MQHNVRFFPDNIVCQVDNGKNLLSAAADAGIYIQASCGGDGVCRKCEVEVIEGEVVCDNAAQPLKTENGRARLACVSSITEDIAIRIPDNSRAGGSSQVLAPKVTSLIKAGPIASLVSEWRVEPPVRKLFVQLPPPSLTDNISDMQRLIREIGKLVPEKKSPEYDHPELLLSLAETLREGSWEVTVILLQGKEAGATERIIAVEAGDTTADLYGLALDIGTTTMTGALVDLNSGTIIAEASTHNGQISCGEDVISRIIYSQRSGGRKILQTKVVGSINTIIEELCRMVIISPSDISFIMAAGNTVMAHLLLGINPKFIREEPYVPSVSQFPLTKASALGIMAHPSVRLFLYPCIASYVGGDIVAGVHACRMHQREEVSLFIDIGTNGEIVVGNRDWMVCAACSAGPAFEGGGIRFGMRAEEGAIENIHIHPQTLEPMIVTVGNKNPRGICGSGLIALLSELLDSAVIDQGGKFSDKKSSQRVRKGTDGWEYVIAWKRDSLKDEDIVITEIDLDNLIRAKAAMFAGYQTLLTSVGLGFPDLDRIILAGNFGAHIDLERAIAIGLLPDVDRDRFCYLGNASLLGCRISLTDHHRFMDRTQVRDLITNFELSTEQEFMGYYMASLFLPHTDAALFPTRINKQPQANAKK